MKRCKRDCKSVKKQGIVSEDRISELPEALILQILSLLPTKVAIATSVLSKQWQSRWKFLPTLNFDSYTSYYYKSELGTFLKTVCKVLLSHKVPVLQRLHLQIRLEICNAMNTKKLIEIAFARNVSELVLYVRGYREQFIFNPMSLYNCEILETLELTDLVLMDVLSSVSLKSLRTLNLLNVKFKDNGSLVNLLSVCPNLENLVVRRIVQYNNVKTFAIAMPSLKRLSIFNGSYEPLKLCWLINAPCLNYLTIEGIYGREFCINKNFPELVEAKIIDVSDEINKEKLMGSLTSVKRLCFSLPPFKVDFSNFLGTPKNGYLNPSIYYHGFSHSALYFVIVLLDNTILTLRVFDFFVVRFSYFLALNIVVIILFMY